MLLVRGGLVAWFRGDHEQARQHVERGLAAARRAGDDLAEWLARHDLAHIGYAIDGNRQAAVDALCESAASARAFGSKIGEALTLCDVAFHNGGTLPDVESGIRAAQLRFGQPLSAPLVDISEAMLHLHRGDLGTARQLMSGPAAATEAAQLECHAIDWSAALGATGRRRTVKPRDRQVPVPE